MASVELTKEWDPTLIALATATSIFGAHATVQFVDEAAKHSRRVARMTIAAGAAVSLGVYVALITNSARCFYFYSKHSAVDVSVAPLL